MKEFKNQLSNQTYALRVGERVPEGDVNLAFVHTPKLDSDQNISLIRTSAAPDNSIPMDQLESMVVPDHTGKLQYADIISEDQPIILRAPYDMFPSRNINITKRFVRNEHTVASALFYKFEIKYHYDSEPGEPGKVVRYAGNQIQLTDENGNQLDSSHKYMIYVQAMTPKQGQKAHVYRVVIYLQFNTNEEKTYKVRYNHVSTQTLDNQAQVVKKTIELYANDKNGKFIEGGKLRIINGIGAFEERTMEEVMAASEAQEVYAIEERPEFDGYRIYVPQKSKSDPREAQVFNYKINASFKDVNGKTRKITFGFVTDSVLNREALLDHELLDYDGEQKILGLRSGGSFLDARSLMQMVAPMDLPSLPLDTVFTIEDAEGNLLYTTTSAPDKATVITEVNPSGSEPPRAKSTVTTAVWEGAKESNVRLKNLPIPHQCTVFAEYQQSEFPFTFEASGEGEIIESTTLEGRWGVKKDLIIANRDTTESIQVFNTWTNIGVVTNRSDWVTTTTNGVKELYLTQNEIDIGGFYNQSALNKKNYMFSADVHVEDNGDDDIIGILFRVKDPKNYYMFAWERNTLRQTVDPKTGNGVGRILISHRGISAVTQNVQMKGYAYEPNMAKYMDYKQSMKNRKKRIFKAVPNFMPPYDASDEPHTRFMSDKTGTSYVDITAFNSEYDPMGWELGKKYRITVLVTDDHFRVYIKSNPTNTTDIGDLVCEAHDTGSHDIEDNGTKTLPVHTQGAYGIFNISQQECYWSNLVFTELELITAVSEMFPVTFTSNAEIKLSEKSAQEILQPKIDALLGNKELMNPNEKIQTIVEGDMRARIKNDYVYGYTNNAQAGGTKITPWRTADNGKNIKGTGMAFLQADGTMGYSATPAILDIEVPENVKNFKWNNIVRLTGDSSVSLSVGNGNKVVATAPVPPITSIGTSFTTEIDAIYKHEGIKTIGKVLTPDGILAKLGIPDSVPKKDILLRIERGDASGNNKEHRVNYRFMYNMNGNKKFEVDQVYNGVNRMRLRNILKPDGKSFLDALQVNLVAWTNFEDLEAVPVLAIRIDERAKIDIDKPRIEKKATEMENWYMRIKNGRMKRRIRLPYFEAQERTPQIYISHPELLPYKPASMDQTTEVVLDYTIPEYVNQEFVNRPVMLIDGEQPVILNENMIQVRNRPITLRSEADISYLEVRANRMNNSRRLRISDVDAAKGIIYLHDRIRDQDEVVVRYAYDEDWYTYRGFSLNESKEVIDVGAPVPLNVKYNAILNAIGKRSETQEGEGGAIQKALLLYDAENPPVYFSELIAFLQSKGITVDLDMWTIEKSAQYNDYQLIITLYMINPVNSTCLQALRSYLANGGSAIITAEHSGLPAWNQNFQTIIADFNDLTVVPAMIVTQNGTFNTAHPLAEGCTSFTMNAASYFTISGSRIQPIAYAEGHVVVAAYENDGQRIVFMTDTNFMDTANGFSNPGNRKMIENIVGWTAPTTIEITETKDAELLNQTFSTTIPSRESAFNERVRIGTVRVYDGFGTEMQQFIDQYVNHTLTLTPSATATEVSLPLVAFEAIYKSDGQPIGSRKAAPNDVIDLFVTVTVPVIKKDVDVPKAFFHMDFNPSPGHRFTLAKNSFHRWVPVQFDLENFMIFDTPGEELLVRPMNIYLKPTSIWLSTEAGIELIAGSVRQTAIYHTDEDYWFDPRDQKYDPSMFRLGKVFVQANSDMRKDMVILDTRTRGGGLDEHLSKEIIGRINKESLHHWDIGYFDGEAYQENGVMIIRLPRSLLSRFTEAQIQAAVAKWKGYGILPIIEYHDDDQSVEVQEI